MIKQQITACVDGSAISGAVCDTAGWASHRLNAPLTLLHVLEKSSPLASEDYSGAIGLGSREYLLDELIKLDERRNKLALEHGKSLLEDARKRAEAAGATAVRIEQRHGRLLDAVLAYEDTTRLFVIGRQGVDHGWQVPAIGSHVENMVRAIQTPVLMATGQFSRPSNYMLAYDGSKTADNTIERIAASPLLSKLPGDLVMVGDDISENRRRLEKTHDFLSRQGHQVQPCLLQGNVIDGLVNFQERHHIELTVMGAYGHSRIREFIVGSNTTKMLATSSVPVLIMR